ncbi:MAG: nicotinamide riboside transporter PnuC [Bauldia sp.]|nr:nicotinamide riboside transporter PnuC [Bauldia sp.]MCW5717723.1 nicotinamide riboside transporter PnuC [Bauldia sp.]
MNPLEWIAASLGVINVVLVVRRKVWNYPFGIAMVVLYCFVFLDVKLYSDALLQVFFLVVQLYGWWNWVEATRAEGEVRVGVLGNGERLVWGAGIVVASLLWGLGMDRLTDAAAPYVDAFVAGASVAAQTLLARRRVEAWVIWIVVDVVAIGLFASRGLMLTAALYVVFLGLAISGLIAWWRAPRASA